MASAASRSVVLRPTIEKCHDVTDPGTRCCGCDGRFGKVEVALGEYKFDLEIRHIRTHSPAAPAVCVDSVHIVPPAVGILFIL